MKTDQYGQIYFNEKELINALYSGEIDSLKNILVDDQSTADQFNRARKLNFDSIDALESESKINIEVTEFDKENQSKWFMPKEYCPNLFEILYGLCQTDEQKNRVSQELELFVKHGMIDLLYYLKYLVDTMRSNNIVWGVGRGSCVASYCLFLIGVHKIDSLKYQLPINEFIK